MTETTNSPARPRPLSPHLQIYRWSLTMAMSILHRATGVANAAGLLIIAWWLIAAASGEAAYNDFRACAGSPIGLFLLFGWSAAFYYHLANGVRHLVWDTGRSLDIAGANRSGVIALIAAGAMTLVTWLLVIAYW